MRKATQLSEQRGLQGGSEWFSRDWFPLEDYQDAVKITSTAWVNSILKMIDFFNFLDMLIILL
jgi:hypothetical protein